jgi:uncharacterized protein (TIGR02611 family)
MERLKRIWHRVPRTVRVPLVLMVGSAIIVAGVAMLVLPGPGLPAIILGFAVLATEFAFAVKVRDWMLAQLKRLIDYCALHAHKIWHKLKH